MKPLAALLPAALAVAAIPLARAAQGPKEPDLRGNYFLVKRDLPDGSTLAPPRVTGFMTFTATYRNMNVSWTEKDGKRVSLSYVAEYTLVDRKYCETPLYWMQNNLMVDGLSYTPPEEKKECSSVTFDAGATVIALKGEPVTLRITAEGLIATFPGTFIDHWKRVE